MGLLELLEAEDVQGFNSSRGDRSRPDLFASDLSGKSLRGVDLSDAQCDKSDLTGADLTEATLVRTSLRGIDGTGMKLVDVLGIRARFKEAWLDEADLSGADLSRGDLAEAVLVGSVARGGRFVGVRLKKADAKRAQWEDADLSEASMFQADFSDADLRRADLSGANGAEVVFQRARLDGAVALQARFPQGRFDGASLSGARLQGADLSGADLTGAHLAAADLTGANLTDAVLTGANLHGAVLADASLDGAKLDGANLRDVDLSGIDPRMLSLSEEAIEGLARYGVPFEPEAPLLPTDVRAGSSKHGAAMVWVNPDTEEQASVRWALVQRNGACVSGVVQVPAASVLARAVLPCPEGFRLLVVRQRPGGVALVDQPLSMSGVLGEPRVTPLGYEPAVRPVLRVEQGAPTLFGLGRRGPLLVVHRLLEEGWAPTHSQRVPTAQGFLGRHHPVLACKGGVVMPISAEGTGAPLRTPPGFPGSKASAVPLDDRVLAVWLVQRVGDTPGGLRTAWLDRRGVGSVEALSMHDQVLDLDAMAAGEHAWVAWIEQQGGERKLLRVRLPGGSPEVISLDAEPEQVRLTQGDLPGMVVSCTDGSAWVADAHGRLLGAPVGGL